MPLKPISELLNSARQGGYAVGYFESWNFESLQGVIDAAEQSQAPMIIGFNGELLTNHDRLASERISWNAALCKAAAESASVPVGMLFNECAQDDAIRQAIEAGFSQAMLDDPKASGDSFVKRASELTKFAHDHGALFEAEVGELPYGGSGEIEDEGCSLTDIDTAAKFVEKTGIDILAVSVGNVHVLLGERQDLDLDHLVELRKRVDVHFDLHGGTGITSESLKKAITLGVTKVCYGTYLKQSYLAALRKALNTEETNPHKLLGFGGQEDVMVAGRIAVRDAVLERIETLGCCGKAEMK
jgi:ketose-bisphosphate aldolase